MAGLRMTHVPYKGAAPAMLGLLSGHVAAAFVSLPNALPYIRGGDFKALAISSATRDPRLPDVPTVAESGYPDFTVETGFWIALPASVRQNVRDEVEGRVRNAVSDPRTRERLCRLGITPASNMSHDAITRWLAREAARWASFVPVANIKLE